VFGCRFSSGGEPERDYSDHFDRLEELSGMRRSGGGQFAVLVLFDPGYPLPNARLRKRAAAVSGAAGFDHFLAIVSDSPLARGVLTAMSWLRPQQHVHEVFVAPHGATDWLEAKRGEPLPALRAIESRLRGRLK
jgi:hypothetical protein